MIKYLIAATPCDEDGTYLPPHTPPRAPSPTRGEDGEAANPWYPFNSRAEFDFAYVHFVDAQTPTRLINGALDLWAAIVSEFGRDAPWKSRDELYASIDAIQNGDAPWKVHRIQYRGPRPPGTPPKWMSQTYELYTRDSRLLLHEQLRTTHFKDKINLSPYRQFGGDKQRIWSNLMSADWAWNQAVNDLID